MSKTTIAAVVGTVLMVLTDIVNYTGNFLPGSWLSGVNAVIAVLTFLSVHVLHTAAVKVALATPPPAS